MVGILLVLINTTVCIIHDWFHFWPRRDKVTGEWGRLHNEKLYDLYFSPNVIQMTIS